MVRSTESSLLFAIALFASQTAIAAINYNLLNSCEQIEELSNKIANEEFSTSCREPETEIEYKIYENSGENYSSICFLKSPPASGLEGFSCMMESAQIKNSVTCVRPASAEDISDYKNSYQNGPQQRTYDYLEEAAACTASNGGATFAAPTLLPRLAGLISKYEFGFISPIGKGRKPNSYVMHGYSTTASNQPPGGIEYVFVLTNGNFPAYEDREILKIGDWEVEIDREGFNEIFNEWLDNQSVPAHSKSIIFNISNSGFAARTMSQKKDSLSEISHKITRNFIAENFSPIPEKSIPEATREAISEMFDKSMPLGFQGIPLGEFERKFKILINEKRPSCTNSNKGAIGAYSFIQYPRPNIKSEYGSIAITIAGMGKCADFSRGSTETYIDGLLDIAAETIRTTYEQH